MVQPLVTPESRTTLGELERLPNRQGRRREWGPRTQLECYWCEYLHGKGQNGRWMGQSCLRIEHCRLFAPGCHTTIRSMKCAHSGLRRDTFSGAALYNPPYIQLTKSVPQ